MTSEASGSDTVPPVVGVGLTPSAFPPRERSSPSSLAVHGDVGVLRKEIGGAEVV
jgi:hypothetical protein